MNTNIIFKLTMNLDSNRFERLFNKFSPLLSSVQNSEDEYLDRSLISKGIVVTYRNSTYKKRITLIINAAEVLDTVEIDSKRLCHKIGKRISKYFDDEYTIDDFHLSQASIITYFDVGSCDKVSSYIKVIKRIRTVKGFSPAHYDDIDDDYSFCLKGNSNGVGFMIYDLEKRLSECSEKSKKYRGLLGAEVNLVKNKAISQMIGTSDTQEQIERIAESSEKIFLDVFSHIVPPGNFYKKDKACELIRKNVKDEKLKRRMISLVRLIPEKKSLLLAQKALNCRRVDDVMREFARIGVSPVTLSKREKILFLDSIFKNLKLS